MTRTTILLTTFALSLGVLPRTALADAPARLSNPGPVKADVMAESRMVREGSEEGPPAAAVQFAEVHPWREGHVYPLAAAPGRVTDIALQPGETLIAVAAGDTARWLIGDTASGSGPQRRTHILVKPVALGLRTNLIITTDRRVYHLNLVSGARAMTGIAWTYADDELLALSKAEAARQAAAPVAAPVAVDRLNFNYAIAGDAPPWRPLRVFDDGTQLFIEFPLGLEGMEAPPLFAIGANGEPELVNYRKRGRYYVVDRLVEAAELRLGEKRQQVVRISRLAGAVRRKRGGNAS